MEETAFNTNAQRSQDQFVLSFSKTDNEMKLAPSTKSYGLCCCCLELVSRKSLWAEYTWMGNMEVYGRMIKECFELNLSRNTSKELICEVCITQLRNALRFKRQVVACQRKLADLCAGHKIIAEKCENIATKNDQNNLTQTDDNNVDYDTPIIKTEEIEIEAGNDAFGESEYDEDDVKLAAFVKHTRRSKVISEVKTKSKQLTRGDPKKTNTEKRKPGARRTNYVKMRQNVCIILEHSTLLPFKSNKGYFNCFYCNKQHAVFGELKAHIATEHKNISFKSIMKSILRPDQVVKADASNLSCKICTETLENVQELVQHLAEAHRIKFNYDKRIKPNDCILPYDLSDGKFRCCVCKSEFLFFKTLSRHMNEHSTSNMCDVCGKCFLLSERLRAHMQMHAESHAVKCEQCGKTCSSSVLLRSHVRYTHNKLSYICSICGETFASFKARIRHLEDVHGRSALNLDCAVCSKRFTTPCSLNAHTKREHLRVQRELKYGCSECSMRFRSAYSLRCHLVVHSGEKNFECGVCRKRYGRAKTLAEHMKIHTNDKRWSCAGCGRAFVQKCSLKNHVRVHHGSVQAEQLIVYKKPDE